MENEIDLELEKVPGSTPEERQHWAKVFQEEEKAKIRSHEYDEAIPRMANLKEQAESTLVDLEKSLPTTLLDWATGKQKRKAVDDLRRSIANYRDLISDCEKVIGDKSKKIIGLIEERRPGLGAKMEKANIARSQIQKKLAKEAEKEKS